MRRYIGIRALIIAILVLCAKPIVAYADFGPKDSLTIYVEHPPNESYYLDLLTTEKGEHSNLNGPETRESLNQDMLKLLYAYEDEGWYPALTAGTTIPMWGSLTGVKDGDRMMHKFGYVGLPETYRIIIVTESGEVSASQPFTRQALQSSITYDYESNKGEVPSIVTAYLLQYATTCIPTLLIELVILFLFGFKLRDNWKVFLFTNLATQVLLTVTLGTALILHGSLTAYFIQFPVELVILIGETILFAKLLRGYTVKRRIAYGIAANIISWGMGFIFLSEQYQLLVSFL